MSVATDFGRDSRATKKKKKEKKETRWFLGSYPIDKHSEVDERNERRLSQEAGQLKSVSRVGGG